MHPAVRNMLGLAYTLRMSEQAVLAGLAEGSDEAVKRTAHTWAKNLCVRMGVRLRVQGLERVDWDQPVVVGSNHQSHVDIPAIIAGLDRPLGFLTKKELFRIPAFGKAIRGLGCVSIDRSDRHSAYRSIAEAAERVRGGASLVVFPEGTRSTDGKLLPFKKGAFYLVQAARVPLVPCGVIGSHRVLRKGGYRAYPGDVEVRLGEPIHCPDDDSAEGRAALSQQLRAAILELTDQQDTASSPRAPSAPTAG